MIDNETQKTDELTKKEEMIQALEKEAFEALNSDDPLAKSPLSPGQKKIIREWLEQIYTWKKGQKKPEPLILGSRFMVRCNVDEDKEQITIGIDGRTIAIISCGILFFLFNSQNTHAKTPEIAKVVGHINKKTSEATGGIIVKRSPENDQSQPQPHTRETLPPPTPPEEKREISTTGEPEPLPVAPNIGEANDMDQPPSPDTQDIISREISEEESPVMDSTETSQVPTDDTDNPPSEESIENPETLETEIQYGVNLSNLPWPSTPEELQKTIQLLKNKRGIFHRVEPVYQRGPAIIGSLRYDSPPITNAIDPIWSITKNQLNSLLGKIDHRSFWGMLLRTGGVGVGCVANKPFILNKHEFFGHGVTSQRWNLHDWKLITDPERKIMSPTEFMIRSIIDSEPALFKLPKVQTTDISGVWTQRAYAAISGAGFMEQMNQRDSDYRSMLEGNPTTIGNDIIPLFMNQIYLLTYNSSDIKHHRQYLMFNKDLLSQKQEIQDFDYGKRIWLDAFSGSTAQAIYAIGSYIKTGDTNYRPFGIQIGDVVIFLPQLSTFMNDDNYSHLIQIHGTAKGIHITLGYERVLAGDPTHSSELRLGIAKLWGGDSLRADMIVPDNFHNPFIHIAVTKRLSDRVAFKGDIFTGNNSNLEGRRQLGEKHIRGQIAFEWAP